MKIVLNKFKKNQFYDLFCNDFVQQFYNNLYEIIGKYTHKGRLKIHVCANWFRSH